jgi:hypothetical protein
MTLKFNLPPEVDSVAKRTLSSLVRKSVSCSYVILFCWPFLWSANAQTAEKKITIVTGRNIPADQRVLYLDALKESAVDAVQQFLGELHLTDEQIDAEMNAVDVQLAEKQSKCLDQTTLLNIYQAVRGDCTTISDGDFDFIASIIVPKGFNQPQNGQVPTGFFPYGLNRLNPAGNSVFEYIDSSAGEREKFKTLIVLGFLNAYWDRVKSKPTLNRTELTILYSGFGKYAEKLHSLCPTFTSSQQQCRNVEQEARQRSLDAKAKEQ